MLLQNALCQRRGFLTSGFQLGSAEEDLQWEMGGRGRGKMAEFIPLDPSLQGPVSINRRSLLLSAQSLILHTLLQILVYMPSPYLWGAHLWVVTALHLLIPQS